MQRLFLLARHADKARTLVERLLGRGAVTGQIHLVGATAELSAELGVDRGSLEELTNLRHSRRLGTGLGAAVGGGLSLIGLFVPQGTLPLEPWLAIGLATICGGSLGLVFGTIMGSAQRHPIYLAHREALQQGAVLIVLDVAEEDIDEVVTLAREIDERMPIETRTLTDVERLA